MRLGSIVMFIRDDDHYCSTDGAMPPLGSIGEIISNFDDDGECDVLFPNSPCPVLLPDASWVMHRTMLIEILDKDAPMKTDEAKMYWIHTPKFSEYIA